MSHKCCSNVIIPTHAKFDSYSAICQGQDECLNNLAPLTDFALLSMLRYGWDGKVWSILPYLPEGKNLHERSGKTKKPATWPTNYNCHEKDNEFECKDELP